MKSSVFTCKEFSIQQQYSALKVGTDSILLGALADYPSPTSILDIGTGTGILSLLMAQKHDCTITAIDIDNGAFLDADYNFKNSKWSNRLTATNISLQDFALQCSTTFDGILCNPPFFTNSLQSDIEVKNIARHTITLNSHILLSIVNQLLSPSGLFYCIVPYTEKLTYMNAAQQNNLYIQTEIAISAFTNTEANRLIMSFGKEWKSLSKKNIAIRNIDKTYSQEYRNLTKDIYLNLK